MEDLGTDGTLQKATIMQGAGTGTPPVASDEGALATATIKVIATTTDP
jgi:hypothetical protein